MKIFTEYIFKLVHLRLLILITFVFGNSLSENRAPVVESRILRKYMHVHVWVGEQVIGIYFISISNTFPPTGSTVS